MHDDTDEVHVPRYDSAAAVDDALSAVKARFDHGDAPYDPDILGLIRAAEAMRAALYGPDGDDPMPVFIIKGKDQLAPHAVDAYLALCERAGLQAQGGHVRRAIAEIQGWQYRHPDQVQLPDHPHVPVAG